MIKYKGYVTKVMAAILSASLVMSAPTAAFATDTAAVTGELLEEAVDIVDEEEEDSEAKDDESPESPEDPGTSDDDNTEDPGTIDDGNQENPSDPADETKDEIEEPSEDPQPEEPQDEQKEEEPSDEEESSETDAGDIGEEIKEEAEEEDEDFFEPTGAREIVEPTLLDGYHFRQIEKEYLFAKADLNILEDMDPEAKTVGHISENGVLYLLKEEGDWLYVESGEVRGFVYAEDVYAGDEASEILESYGFEDLEEADWSEYEAEADVDRLDNAAYTYERVTTQQVLIDKVYALTEASTLNIREGKGTDYDIVGKLTNGSLMYIIADEDEDWVYVESGESRGFVSSEYIQETDAEVIEANGEGAYSQATTLIEPEDNDAYYYTLTSIIEGSSIRAMGESIVEYASLYIGNPYVWGGTSLTDGADCSGFVLSIYAQYGISLPRTAAMQSQVGTAIALEDAIPGDLVFYQNEYGHVYHVAIYAGNGRTVEAANSTQGIISGNVYSDYAWCVRVLTDE